VKDNPAVIGYQLDNETKAYQTSGPNVQAAFVEHMKAKFHGDLNALNTAYGLNYWSNRINRWEDFPSTNGSINASLSAAFAEFQRGLVTDYLAWQASLVRAHARPDQFMTQNFDLDWRGYSYGVQTEVNHWEAAKSLDVAGIDIYHPGQDKLTGTEIAMGGDLARSIKFGQNYLVMETTAQGFPEWTPTPASSACKPSATWPRARTCWNTGTGAPRPMRWKPIGAGCSRKISSPTPPIAKPPPSARTSPASAPNSPICPSTTRWRSMSATPR
jgi:beta-galactosidase GanA